MSENGTSLADPVNIYIEVNFIPPSALYLASNCPKGITTANNPAIEFGINSTCEIYVYATFGGKFRDFI
jgi:hypothetical protein